ncbi:MAG: spore maturation protein [bacterium]|nr:spore maturation protein [bacterium]
MFAIILKYISIGVLPLLIFVIMTVALVKKVPVYETFTEGAKDGLKVSANIFPYLIAIIVSISMLRASGALEALGLALKPLLDYFNLTTDIIPVIFVRPLSGSAALGLFAEIAKNDVTSYATKLAAIMVGSSETTFYVLAVYFGSVGISKYRYALWVGILADIIAAIMSIIVCAIFFL